MGFGQFIVALISLGRKRLGLSVPGDHECVSGLGSGDEQQQKGTPYFAVVALSVAGPLVLHMLPRHPQR